MAKVERIRIGVCRGFHLSQEAFLTNLIFINKKNNLPLHLLYRENEKTAIQAQKQEKGGKSFKRKVNYSPLLKHKWCFIHPLKSKRMLNISLNR